MGCNYITQNTLSKTTRIRKNFSTRSTHKRRKCFVGEGRLVAGRLRKPKGCPDGEGVAATSSVGEGDKFFPFTFFRPLRPLRPLPARLYPPFFSLYFGAGILLVYIFSRGKSTIVLHTLVYPVLLVYNKYLYNPVTNIYIQPVLYILRN